MKSRDGSKNVLSDKSLEQVVGGVDDGSPDNNGKIPDDYAKKDKQVVVMSKIAALEVKKPEGSKGGPIGGGAGIIVPEGGTLIVVGNGE